MKASLSIVGWASLAATSPVLADGAQPFAAPAAAVTGASSGAAGLGQVTLALAIVLVAVFAFAWVARQLRGGVGGRRGGAIEVLGDVALGQKERAVLLKVGRAHLLVGVAPGSVRTLHLLPEDSGIASSTADPAVDGARPSFRAILLKRLGR